MEEAGKGKDKSTFHLRRKDTISFREEDLSDGAKIYAIGDVHGDYYTVVAILQKHNLISFSDEAKDPEKVKWNGDENTFLVQIGDMVNKGGHSIEVLQLFMQLQNQKPNRVFVLMGNHELTCIKAEGKKSEDYKKHIKKRKKDLKNDALKKFEEVVKQTNIFIANLYIAVRLGDWLFCHAGNFFTYDKILETKNLEADYEKLLHPSFGPINARVHDNLTEDDALPWWCVEEKHGKIKPLDNDTEKCYQMAVERLQQKLTDVKAKHLVIGHQPGKIIGPKKNGAKREVIREKFDIKQLYSGLLFCIDGGLSLGVNPDIQAPRNIILIENQKVSTLGISIQQETKEIWRANVN